MRRPGSRTHGRPTTTDRVHSITSTQTPLGADIDRRARRYLVQMGIRTVCFLGAVFTWGRVPTWLSVVMLVSAVVLPYVAVVLANAGRERPDRADSPLDLREIGAAPLHPPVGGTSPFTAPPFGPATFTDPDTGESFTVPGPAGPARPAGPDGSRRD